MAWPPSFENEDEKVQESESTSVGQDVPRDQDADLLVTGEVSNLKYS